MINRNILIALLSLVVLSSGCGKKDKSTPPAPRVLLLTVDSGSTSLTTYPGRTRASDEANVSFRVSGTLLSVSVHDGDRVHRGQVIAQLDDRDYRVQLAATEAEYTQVKAEAERVMALYADSVTTANQYDKARYGLQQITQKLQHCRDQVADCVLRAPFSGFVKTVLHESHETVGAGMPVLSLIAEGQTEVVINIPASDYQRRDQFVGFTARFDVLPGEVFPLHLLSISPQANVNQLYEVRLALPTNNRQITPGMSTIVQVSYGGVAASAVRVPINAVVQRDGDPAVFVYDNGHVRRTPVKLGNVHTDGNVDVLEGLRAGMQIVVSGVQSLTDGQAAQPAPQPSKTNVGGLL